MIIIPSDPLAPTPRLVKTTASEQELTIKQSLPSETADDAVFPRWDDVHDSAVETKQSSDFLVNEQQPTIKVETTSTLTPHLPYPLALTVAANEPLSPVAIASLQMDLASDTVLEKQSIELKRLRSSVKKMKAVPLLRRRSDSIASTTATAASQQNSDNVEIAMPPPSIVRDRNTVPERRDGHSLVELIRYRTVGHCVTCLKKNPDPDFKRNMPSIITHCPKCPGGSWICKPCFLETHPAE